jgi:hypothetical protein
MDESTININQYINLNQSEAALRKRKKNRKMHYNIYIDRYSRHTRTQQHEIHYACRMGASRY